MGETSRDDNKIAVGVLLANKGEVLDEWGEAGGNSS
jgi:hypothetical protein